MSSEHTGDPGAPCINCERALNEDGMCLVCNNEPFEYPELAELAAEAAAGNAGGQFDVVGPLALAALHALTRAVAPHGLPGPHEPRELPESLHRPVADALEVLDTARQFYDAVHGMRPAADASGVRPAELRALAVTEPELLRRAIALEDRARAAGTAAYEAARLAGVDARGKAFDPVKTERVRRGGLWAMIGPKDQPASWREFCEREGLLELAAVAAA